MPRVSIKRYRPAPRVRVRTDFTWHLQDVGILHRRIPRGCPASNGKVELSHRDLSHRKPLSSGSSRPKCSTNRLTITTWPKCVGDPNHTSDPASGHCLKSTRRSSSLAATPCIVSTEGDYHNQPVFMRTAQPPDLTLAVASGTAVFRIDPDPVTAPFPITPDRLQEGFLCMCAQGEEQALGLVAWQCRRRSISCGEKNRSANFRLSTWSRISSRSIPTSRS